MARHGYRGDGAHGQFCVVVPDADLVVATTARVDDMQQVLDVLWEHLLPALDSTDTGDADELTRRLATLALPAVTPTRDHAGGPVRFVVDGDAPDQPFARGTEVTVSPDGSGTLLTIGLPRTELAVPCGRDHWAESLVGPGAGTGRGARGAAPADPVPLVARGGWTGPETFEADVVLIETPHRIRLRGNGSRLEAQWNVPPL